MFKHSPSISTGSMEQNGWNMYISIDALSKLKDEEILESVKAKLAEAREKAKGIC